jgi:hypothetical protein
MQLVAGTSNAGYSGDSNPATTADVVALYLWVDTMGTVYLPDYDNFVIRKVDSTGIITLFGGTGSSSAEGMSDDIQSVSFYKPFSIVGNLAGTLLYISDRYYIWKFEFSTNVATVYAQSTTLPAGFSGDGGPASSAQLNSPNGMWLTTSGVLFIADTGNERIRKITSQGSITTIAGSGSGTLNFAGDNGPATSALLKYPAGVYVDSMGKLFIADYSNNRIRLVDTNNIITTFAGNITDPAYNGEGIPALSAGFLANDVKGDSLGNIYIADYLNCLVRRIDANGIILSLFGDPGNCGFTPGLSARGSSINNLEGLWVDTVGNVYFSDYVSVRRGVDLPLPTRLPTVMPTISSTSIYSNTFLKLVGGTGTVGFSGDNGPASLAQMDAYIPWVDSMGTIYIPDFSNHRIRKIDSFGTITTFGGTGSSSTAGVGGPVNSVNFNVPYSIVGDNSRTVLYISDQRYVWRYLFSDSTATVYAHSTSLTPGYSGDGGPATLAQLFTPQGLWLTTSGDLYVAEDGNDRVRKISSSSFPSSGIITTVAGSVSGGGFSGDNGPATLAALRDPRGVYMDTNGKLFIADVNNGRIRVVDTNNIITTFAGSSTFSPFNGDNIAALSANINAPSDVKGDSLGNIYISDINNCLIRVVSVSGIMSTLLGNPDSCGFNGGGFSSRTSKINRPNGMWVDSLARVYVGERSSIHQSAFPSSPSSQPSSTPSIHPTRLPSTQPSTRPSVHPTSPPSRQPSSLPSGQPRGHPTSQPSGQPIGLPTALPRCCPTAQPSRLPTSPPSRQPFPSPTIQPSGRPSALPSAQLSKQPTGQPTFQPSSQPSSHPSSHPSGQPSRLPTVQPSDQPTEQPLSHPSAQPILSPTSQPSELPTRQPTQQPSSQPFPLPTHLPSAQPTGQPSCRPTSQPSRSPSSSLPSSTPSNQPTSHPSLQPSSVPTRQPSSSCPSTLPTRSPSDQPSSVPSYQPVSFPSSLPTNFPTSFPSRQPTSLPSTQPTGQPSLRPSSAPSTQPSSLPSSGQPSSRLSLFPSVLPTSIPSVQPTSLPTNHPSKPLSSTSSQTPSDMPTLLSSTSSTSSLPTLSPSIQPTSLLPTVIPSIQPLPLPLPDSSKVPTHLPTSQPSVHPSRQPSAVPSKQPFSSPSVFPSSHPSSCQPTSQPSRQPFSPPSSQPTNSPTSQPSSRPSSPPSSSFPSGQPTTASHAPQAPSISFCPTMTKRPSRSPTRRPTVIPTLTPTAFFSVLPTTNARFQGSLFLLGTTRSDSQPADDDDITRVMNINLASNPVHSHDAYILFGQKKKFSPTIDLTNSRGVVSRVSQSLLSREDPNNHLDIRSATIVGDINRDGYSDLIIGYPFSSQCFVYFGRSSSHGFSNLVVSFMIYGEAESEFGWAVSGIGDINEDQYDDYMISAKAIGVIYVFFGRKATVSTTNIDLRKNHEQLTPDEGFKIIGSTSDGLTFNLGVSLSSAGDFNKDGVKDLMFSTMAAASSQGIVYILFGKKNHSSIFNDIHLDQLLNNSSSSSSHSILTILCPSSSFSAMSLTGIGDINQDGFDDIAIGSLPYRGAYQPQRTYLIYGRPVETKSPVLDLRGTREEGDGIIILLGGGFLVASPGDLNKDGMADLLIINYPFWQRESLSYFIQFPENNITSSPTLFPSSTPSSPPSSLLPTVTQTTETPSNRPSIRRTDSPTILLNPSTSSFPSFPLTMTPTRPPKATAQPKSTRPTYLPTFFPSRSPSRRPTFSPSLVPSTLPTFATADSTRSVSVRPSQSSGSQRLSRQPTSTSHPTFLPTFFNVSTLVEEFETVHCNNTVICKGVSTINNQFIIQSGGTVRVECGSSQRCVYLVLPVEISRIILEDFDINKDIIDLTQFPWLKSMTDLSFTTNPQVILLGKTQEIFFRHNKDHATIDFTSTNFYFASDLSSKKKKNDSYNSGMALQFAIIGFFAVFFGIIGILLGSQRKDELKQYIKEKDELESLERGGQANDDDDEEEEVEDFEISTVSEEEQNLINSPPRYEHEHPIVDIHNENDYDEDELSSFSSFISDFQNNDHDNDDDEDDESGFLSLINSQDADAGNEGEKLTLSGNSEEKPTNNTFYPHFLHQPIYSFDSSPNNYHNSDYQSYQVLHPYTTTNNHHDCTYSPNNNLFSNNFTNNIADGEYINNNNSVHVKEADEDDSIHLNNNYLFPLTMNSTTTTTLFTPHTLSNSTFHPSFPYKYDHSNNNNSSSLPFYAAGTMNQPNYSVPTASLHGSNNNHNDNSNNYYDNEVVPRFFSA